MCFHRFLTLCSCLYMYIKRVEEKRNKCFFSVIFHWPLFSLLPYSGLYACKLLILLYRSVVRALKITGQNPSLSANNLNCVFSSIPRCLFCIHVNRKGRKLIKTLTTKERVYSPYFIQLYWCIDKIGTVPTFLHGVLTLFILAFLLFIASSLSVPLFLHVWNNLFRSTVLLRKRGRFRFLSLIIRVFFFTSPF